MEQQQLTPTTHKMSPLVHAAPCNKWMCKSKARTSRGMPQIAQISGGTGFTRYKPIIALRGSLARRRGVFCEEASSQPPQQQGRRKGLVLPGLGLIWTHLFIPPPGTLSAADHAVLSACLLGNKTGIYVKRRASSSAPRRGTRSAGRQSPGGAA